MLGVSAWVSASVASIQRFLLGEPGSLGRSGSGPGICMAESWITGSRQQWDPAEACLSLLLVILVIETSKLGGADKYLKNGEIRIWFSVKK